MALLTQRPNNFDLFDTFDSFFRRPDYDRFGTRGLVPSVNVSENIKDYELDVAAPGLKKEDFDVNIENDVITVSREEKHEDEKKEDNFTRREFSYSSFSRSFRLPEDVDRENISARYEDGVLKLTLPKLGEEDRKTTKKIEIS